MKDRTLNKPIAATRIESGTDVNFGALTRILFAHLKNKNVDIKFNHHVDDIKRTGDGSWELKVRNVDSGTVERHTAKFVFIGGGGGSLHLLQKSGIPEGKGIGGFPVSGLFMVCQNPDIVAQHHAKVYGKASVGAPPMSVPHLDTRFIDNKESLLFGPFAGFSPKFLKFGSMLDLVTSVKPHNLVTMMAAGVKKRFIDNIPDQAGDVIERTAHGSITGIYPERQKRGLGFAGSWPACANYQRYGCRQRNASIWYGSD